MLARNTRLVSIRPTKKISLQNYNWKLGVYRCDVWSVKSATNSDNKHLLYIYVLYIPIETYSRCRVHDFSSDTCKCIELEINRECFVEYIKVHMQRTKYESGIFEITVVCLSWEHPILWMKRKSKTKIKKYGDQICDRDNILDQMSGHYRYHLICPLPYNPLSFPHLFVTSGFGNWIPTPGITIGDWLSWPPSIPGANNAMTR